jgi:hypothetical protein
MKKKLLIISLIAILATSLTACGEDKTPSTSNGGNRFVDTGYSYYIAGYDYKVSKDTETDILYLAYSGGYGGGLTVLLDKDGKPMKWANFKK